MTIMRKTRRVDNYVVFGHLGDKLHLGCITEINTNSYKIEAQHNIGVREDGKTPLFPAGTLWWVSKHLVFADVKSFVADMTPRRPRLDLDDPNRLTVGVDVIFLNTFNQPVQGRITKIWSQVCSVKLLVSKSTELIFPSRITPLF